MPLMRNVNEETAVRKRIHDDFQKFFRRHSRTSTTPLKYCRWRVYIRERKAYFLSVSIAFPSLDSLEGTFLKKKKEETQIPSSFLPDSILIFKANRFPPLGYGEDQYLSLRHRQEWHSRCSCKRRGASRRWVGELSVATSALRNVNLLLLLLPTPSGGIRQGHGPRKRAADL